MKKIIATVTISVSIMSLLTCAAFAGDKGQNSNNMNNGTYLASSSSMWNSAYNDGSMQNAKDNDDDDSYDVMCGNGNGNGGNGNNGHHHHHHHGHDVSDY